MADSGSGLLSIHPKPSAVGVHEHRLSSTESLSVFLKDFLQNTFDPLHPPPTLFLYVVKTFSSRGKKNVS